MSESAVSSNSGIGIVAGAVRDRFHAVLVSFENAHETVVSALFGERDAAGAHIAPSREPPERAKDPDTVLEAVHRHADGADVLLVYLSGVLTTAKEPERPVLGLTERRHPEGFPGKLDIDSVLAAAGAANTAVVIIDGQPAEAAAHDKPAPGSDYDSNVLKGWVERKADAHTCLLIGVTPKGHAAEFAAAFRAALRGRVIDVLRSRNGITVGALAGRLSPKRASPYELVSGVEACADERLPVPGGPRRPIEPPTWSPKARLLVAVAVVVSLIAAVVTYALRSPPSGSAACRPPLELRVLSSPESYPAVQEAATRFADQRRDSSGCRLVHLTVYQANTDAALRGFGQAAGWARPPTTAGKPGTSCPGTGAPPADRDGSATGVAPGRDIGPRPDIWLPDSTSDVGRARCVAPESAVSFGETESIAWSPLVLGVFQPANDQYFSTQDDWVTLRDKVARARLDLIRPNPATSSAGLLHTVAMYRTLADDQPGIADLESRLVTETLPLSDSADLLCHLASTPYTPSNGNRAGPAVLVSETSLVNYNLGTLPNCPAGPPRGASESLRAHCPPDTPALDHPFVSLTWSDEPGTKARADAVRGFREWLLSDRGQQTLAGAGLRPVREVTREPGNPLDSTHHGACRDVPSPARQPNTAQVQDVINSYAAAHEPGRVTFLLDVSLSMNANDNLETAKGIIGSSVSLMGEADQVALTTVPRTTGDSAELNPLIPLGNPSTGAELRTTLGGVAAQRNGVALYAAIDRQLSLLAASPGPTRQTLVVLTGGEDSFAGKPLSGATTADALLARHQHGRSATVQIVAFSPATCAGDLGRLATALGGQCITTVDNRTPAAVVAGVWQGGGDG